MERKLVAAAVATALGVPMAADAVELKASGHVNAAIVVQQTDDDSNAEIVDANGSETRFRFTGSEELESGMTVGVQLEIGAGGGVRSYNQAMDDDDMPEGNENDFRIRHANVSITSEAGKVTFGQAAVAADGAVYADVGSSWIAGATMWCSYAGSGPACATFSGGRAEVIRYDTPALGPAKLMVSAGNDDYWDLQGRVGGSLGDSGYDLRIAYIDPAESISGSAAFTMSQGTGVAVAWGQADEASVQYVKLDHTYGDGSVGVYYKTGEDADGNEGTLYGVGVGHAVGGGATVYAGYRFIDNDGEDELNIILAGMRVTFN